MISVVNYWQLLNFIFLKNLGSCNQVCLKMCSYKIFTCHDLINLLVQMTLETKVTVCNNTNQVILVINYRNTTDMLIMHHIKSVLHCTATTDSDRVINHTILSTLNDSDLTSLFLDSHVLVNHTDTTFTGDSNRH